MKEIQRLALAVHKDILELKNTIEGSFIDLAKNLKSVRDDELHKQLDYDTFESYIASPELSFERTKVYKLIAIYETFILEHKYKPKDIADIGWGKLERILPNVRSTAHKTDEFLGMARGLSLSDLKEELRELNKKPPVPLPEGQFNVIYADPPWQYDNAGISGAAENHYPTMPIEDICNLKIPSASNSVLFLWVTNPLLKEGLQVVENWGFEYKTNIVWIKEKAGQGFYVKGQHELLLICTKGSFVPDNTLYVRSVVGLPREEHSKKPQKFYEIIEELYPKAKYLELFARNKRQGWTSWGNQI